VTEPDIAALAGRAIAIAEQTAATLEKIVKAQTAIVTTQHRIKVFARWLAVSLAVDIALSVSLLFVVGHQIALTHAIHESQLAACAIGNEFRVSQAQVWGHFITTSTAPPGETAAQRAARLARLAGARTYISHHYLPVNCAILYGK
jgi:hypothetical protein